MDHLPALAPPSADRDAAAPSPASAARNELARLFDASIVPLYAFIARRSPNRAAAESATTRTFERAAASLRRDGGGSRVTLGWLYRLAGLAVLPSPVDPLPRLARALGGDRGRALRRLDDDQRGILVLRYFDGIEPADLRTTLGLSDATLRSALDAAVSALDPADPAGARTAVEAALERFDRLRGRDEREVPSPGFASALRERLLAPPPPSLTPSTSPSIVLAPRPTNTPGARPSTPPRTLAEGVPGPRWTALVVIGVLMLSAVAVRGSASPATIARAFDADRAVVVRDGVAKTLSTGEGLLADDLVTVRGGGHASVVLGGADLWLDSGASVRIVAGSPDAVVIEQLTGRVRHRTMVTPDSTYQVATATLTWTAHEGVFDISREASDEDGGTIDVGVHRGAVRLAGPDLAASVAAGRAATAKLREGAPDLTTRDMERFEGPSPWLIEPSEAPAP